jgi:hypothetical protein
MSLHKVEYSIRGEHFSAYMVESYYVKGTAGCYPGSATIVCPTCGEAWAKRVVDEGKQGFTTIMLECDGTLFLWYENPMLIQCASSAVLKRELNLLAHELKQELQPCQPKHLYKP